MSTNIPIGGIISWAKSASSKLNTILPHGWVQCDGQTINDVNSPFDGIAVPELNSTNKVFVGNVSSGTTEDGFTDAGTGNIYYVIWIIRIK